MLYLLFLLFLMSCVSEGDNKNQKRYVIDNETDSGTGKDAGIDSDKKCEWIKLNSKIDRTYHAAVIFNQKIWILGGISWALDPASGKMEGRTNDIIYSNDGEIWGNSNSSDHWSPGRAAYCLCVLCRVDP